MKNCLLVAVLLLCSVALFAQHIPLGMKYQAVARDQKGSILANKQISLRINLNSQNSSATEAYYTETHQVTTNKLGLFTLVLGEGQQTKGAFSKVPWSTEDIWMEVSINDKGNTDFSVVSNSRLLAVPYAFHAATASQLAGGSQRQDGSSSPSNNWITFGNSGTNPEVDRLGTTDMADLVIITNNIERMRVYSNGNIGIVNDLSIGKDLHVKANTFLNETSGQTLNYGPFKVLNESPTILSGTLTVDLATDLNSSLNVDGITNLNSHLNVNYMSPTKLTGTLRVDGITDLNAALNVNNMATTTLSGKLIVQKDALFKDSVFLDDATHQSYTPNDGALVVAGGFGLGGNLNVGGDAKFGGATEFAGAVSITDQTQSTSTSTGALKVSGGVGIGKNLYVGQNSHLLGTLNVTGATALASTLGVTGATTLSSTLAVTGAASLASTLTVTGASQLNNTLGVTGIASFTNAAQSTSTATGALKVTGGAGIAKNLYVGEALNVAGAVTMSGGLVVSKSAAGADVATFTNTANGNGISIQVGNSAPTTTNNFITFKNSSGGAVGRIEGETLADLPNNSTYTFNVTMLDFSVATATVATAIAGFEVAQAGVDLAASLSSSTACVGFGACITAPIPSFIIAAGTNLALKIANAVNNGIQLGVAVANKINYESSYKANIGVTYQSGSGDYAEWLPKAVRGEKYMPGAIVGVHNGKISLNTRDASQLLVVSTKPFMLGNMPAEGNEEDYEKIAFMGQVPVLVAGKVNMGDYIIASGNNDGVGFAKSKSAMEVEDYSRIVGIAWSASNEMLSKVNVAIGINANELSAVVKKQDAIIKDQDDKINDLKREFEETKSMIAKLVPGFKEIAPGSVQENNAHAAHDTPLKQPDATASGAFTNVTPITPAEDQVIYYNVSRNEIMTMFQKAEQMSKESGVDMKYDAFWKKFHSEAAFQNEVIAQVQKKFDHAVHWHKKINHEATSATRTFSK